jgi:hypothetical protein
MIHFMKTTENKVLMNAHLCGIGVRVPGYRTKGLGSIPGDTRFSDK